MVMPCEQQPALLIRIRNTLIDFLRFSPERSQCTLAAKTFRPRMHARLPLLNATAASAEWRRYIHTNQLLEPAVLPAQEGVEAPPRIVFQKIDVFDCWLWFEFYQVRSDFVSQITGEFTRFC